MKEIWKKILRFPGYFASNLGNIKSIKSMMGTRTLILKPQKTGTRRNYLKVFLRKNGKSHQIYLHHLILETFRSKKPNNMECGHLNGDSFDNRLCNLKWITAKENSLHRKLHGTHRVNAKINEFAVRAIRASKNKSDLELALLFNISRKQIMNIKKYRRWKNVV